MTEKENEFNVVALGQELGVVPALTCNIAGCWRWGVWAEWNSKSSSPTGSHSNSSSHSLTTTGRTEGPGKAWTNRNQFIGLRFISIIAIVSIVSDDREPQTEAENRIAVVCSTICSSHEPVNWISSFSLICYLCGHRSCDVPAISCKFPCLGSVRLTFLSTKEVDTKCRLMFETPPKWTLLLHLFIAQVLMLSMLLFVAWKLI